MMKFVFAFAFLLSHFALANEHATAEVFEQKTNFGKKLFDMDIQVTDKDGVSNTVALYKDLNGQVAVEEKGIVKGDQMVSFDVDQRQTQEKGHIEIEGDKAVFTYEKDGKKKTSEEKIKGSFLTAANFNYFIATHWKELTSGETVEVRFAVWFRLETVGFKIFKTGEAERNGQKLVTLRMKPSSFVIAALVDPLNLSYSADGKHLMELSGRVAPKLLKNGSWKDLDADVRYLHL